MSSSLQLDEQTLRTIVEDVMRSLGRSPIVSPAPSPAVSAAVASAPPAIRRGGPRFGVFDDVKEACAAAQDAFEQLKTKGIAGRAKVVEIVKALCTEKAAEWGKFEFEETKIGRLEHKIEKLQIVKLVPGVEWIKPYGLSGDHGITMEEHTPFGVVGAVLPVTHSVPTLSGNVINIVAAGNAVVFNPHPGGARSAALAVRTYNEAIFAALGIENLVCTVEKPSLESFDALTKNEFIRLLCITGGPAVVGAAMKSGKRAICAGPGNPPVLVDGTGCLKKAARDVLQGGAFDNNLLCIGEKQVFVLEQHFDKFIDGLKIAGAVQLNGSQLAKLTAAAFTTSKDAGGCSHAVLNRKLVGADASVLAQHAGTSAAANTPMLFAETDVDHAFVMEEQMMPMLPVVRVKSIEQGIEFAKKSEHGYKHSAIIHSLNVDHMTMMARALDTTLFVKNGPSVAGLGLGGEGYLSYSIATTTGEGITTPETFTRTRRCVMVDNLRIY
ncbi:aldehyde dehydrogenase family protein [Horticoccus sp. 23ND18S-11]|uniref:aldehyde dehydrogenase family protein n=1 Tax=Horticoccus sp. 23ND18S-11 TaxID=3391832 RepID=UPI0039C8C844